MTNNQDNQTDTAQAKPPVTIITNAAKFQLGQCVATPGALALLEKTGFSAAFLINRHLHSSWGDVCKEDAELNEMALKDGSRIMSVYRLVSPEKLKATPRSKRSALQTVWVITDAADDDGVRRCTTVLLPEDY
ncbi:type I restriction endonuclease subunit M [Ottowia thiooxydans]|uniref:type I restriction endonuclease subunit M n=1 Tax=Ottowia thiooxydans TaxID=219182 RepID=UPI00041474F9|nr:type I restriction endonuclease subunit M [Ottowia thiooxydans]